MNLCEFTLGLLALAAGTYFWLWYLVWEYEHWRDGKKRTRWWERDIHMLLRADSPTAEPGGFSAGWDSPENRKERRKK